jgi:hypothetical protein
MAAEHDLAVGTDEREGNDARLRIVRRTKVGAGKRHVERISRREIAVGEPIKVLLLVESCIMSTSVSRTWEVFEGVFKLAGRFALVADVVTLQRR